MKSKILHFFYMRMALLQWWMGEWAATPWAKREGAEAPLDLGGDGWGQRRGVEFSAARWPGPDSPASLGERRSWTWPQSSAVPLASFMAET